MYTYCILYYFILFIPIHMLLYFHIPYTYRHRYANRQRSRGGRSLHVALAALLGCLSTADLSLTVGAGGARVSLPLVLFAVTECGYVPPAVSQQRHVQPLSGYSFAEQIFQTLLDPFGTC